MKKLKFLTLLLVVIYTSACQKDNPPTTSNGANDFFISFDLDGISIEHRTTNVSYSTTGAPATSISRIILLDSAIGSSIDIQIGVNQDSIVGADFLALIGQKVEVGYCSGSPCGVKAKMEYNTPSYDLESEENNNPLPNYYIKINSAAYHSTAQLFGVGETKFYLIEGEFNLRMEEYGGVLRDATNGQFRLLFPEHK